MTEKRENDHNEQVVSQFTKQAIPFTTLPGHLDAIEMLIEMSSVSAEDRVLDVACGPGLVACEFAKIAKHVTGIDLTEEMIKQAKKRQVELGLQNVSWDLGTALPLPYADDSFSIVLTRYSFHHFLDPQSALKEMIRVCKPGGSVLIADAALPGDKIEAYNTMEKLRDPSHTRALSYEEWEELLKSSGLQELRRGHYDVAMELEAQLAASFPNPGDNEKLREIFEKDVDTDTLGMNVHRVGNAIHFSYPISIYVGKK